MSPELKDLLHETARRPLRPVDADEIHRRGRRRTAVRTTAAGTALALVAVLGVVAGLGTGSETDTNVVVGPPDVTGEDRGGDDVGPPTPAEALGVDLIRLHDDGQSAVVTVEPADGTSDRTYSLDVPAGSPVTVAPDDAGGFYWQDGRIDVDDLTVHHVGADGQQRTVIDLAPDSRERAELVGSSDGRALVAHSNGAPTPEGANQNLVALGPDGTGDIVRQRVGGWESSVLDAAGSEVLAFIWVSEGFVEGQVADPADEIATVLEGQDGQGPRPLAVDADDRRAYFLVRDQTGSGDRDLATISVVDLASASVVDEIEVPSEVGGPTAVDIALEGEHLLVSRRADDSWSAPLHHDLDSGEWSTLEGPAGAVTMGRAHSTQPDGPAAECQSSSTPDQAPAGDGTLHLYLACSGDQEPVAHRTDLGQRSGGPAADARRVLDALLGDLPDEQRAQGYLAPGDDAAIGVHTVAFDAGVLTVDFDFPDTGGVGSVSTSHGSAVWHRVLAANLFQLDEVSEVHLLADGTCEGYSEPLQGAGCFVFGPGDAPWATPTSRD